MNFNYDPNTSFGCEKNSYIGRFGDEWAVEWCATDDWVNVQHNSWSCRYAPGLPMLPW